MKLTVYEIRKKERIAQAIKMRSNGEDWESIATALGLKTAATIRRYVTEYYASIASEHYETLRPILNERAESLWAVAWKRANGADSIEEWDKAMKQAVNAVNLQARINNLISTQPQIAVSVENNTNIIELQNEFKALIKVSENDE